MDPGWLCPKLLAGADLRDMSEGAARPRVLATVLFTDVVDSTRLATELGDRRWKEVLARHHAIIRRHLKRRGGRELDTAGDGFFASFKEPAGAILCACEAVEELRDLGLEIRSGVHFGECEVMGKKLSGITVVVSSRIMALAGPGDVLVSRTVRDVVTGARFGFEDRGVHELKGVDGDWHVFGVTSVEGKVRTPLLDLKEAAARRDSISPAPLLESNRTRALMAGVMVVVIAVAAFVYQSLNRGQEALTRIPPGSIGQIDPASNEILRTIHAGYNPGVVAVVPGAVWVVLTDLDLVERVDPGSGRIDKSLTPQCKPTQLAADEDGAIWVLCGFQGTLQRIDPSRITFDRPIHLPGGSGYSDLVVGEGAVWITDVLRGRLLRVDPLTKAIDPSWNLPARAEPSSLTIGGGFVWVVAGSTLYKVNPSDPSMIDPIGLQWTGDDVAFGAGAVWIVHTLDDQLTRVDATEISNVNTVAVGDQPLSVSYGANAVWVANYLGESLSEVDVEANQPAVTIALGGRPWAVATGPAGVWVSVGR
jgi:class 3 adenylate cyclase